MKFTIDTEERTLQILDKRFQFTELVRNVEALTDDDQDWTIIIHTPEEKHNGMFDTWDLNNKGIIGDLNPGSGLTYASDYENNNVSSTALEKITVVNKKDEDPSSKVFIKGN